MKKVELLKPWKNQFISRYTSSSSTHKHEKWELVFFYRGKTMNIVNGVQYLANTGDIIFLGKNHLHDLTVLTKDHVHYDLYYDNEIVDEILKKYNHEIRDKILSGELVVNYKLDYQLFTALMNQLFKLEKMVLNESLKGDKADYLMCDILSRSILEIVLSSFVSDYFYSNSEIPNWLYDIWKKIQDPEVFTKNVDDIIKLSNYSHTHFSTIFKKYYGVSLINYLLDLRLEYAQNLLQTTNDTTTEICLASGYDSYSYFMKLFKKRYSMSPKQYQIWYRKKRENDLKEIKDKFKNV